MADDDSIPHTPYVSPSGGTGRGHVGGVDVPGKSHIVLVTEDNCRGYVQRSGESKICLDENCSTEAHQANKLEVRQCGAYFVKVPRRSKAFVGPRIEGDDIPGSVTAVALLKKENSPDVLREYMRSLASKEGPLDDSGERTVQKEGMRTLFKADDDDEGWTQAVPVCHRTVRRPLKGGPENPEASLARITESLKTPAAFQSTFKTSGSAMRGDDTKVDVIGLQAEMEGLLSPVDDEDESVDGEGGGYWPRTKRSMGLFGSKLLVLSNAHNSLSDQFLAATDLADKRQLDMRRALQVINGKMGEPPAESVGSTVWEILQSYSEISSEEEGGAVAGSSELTQAAVKQLHAQLDAKIDQARALCVGRVGTLSANMKRAVVDISANIKVLGDDLYHKLGTGGQRARPQTGQPPSLPDADAVSRIRRAEHRITALEANPTRPPETNLAATLPGYVTRVDSLTKRVAGIEHRVSGHTAFKSDDGVFSTLEDVKRLVITSGMEDLVGFQDVLSLLIQMTGEAMTGQEHASRAVSSKRADRKVGESELLATFTREAPPIMFAGTATDGKLSKVLVEKTHGFGSNMKTYQMFDETLNSKREEITTMIRDLVASLEEALDTTDVGDRLKLCMLRRAKEDAMEVLAVATNFYRALTTACKYPEKEAWILVGRSMRLYFRSLKAIRAKASGVEEIGSPLGKARIIWTLMQSHNKSREILQGGFQSHPIIMKEVLEFQLEHRVDASQMRSLQEDVKLLRNQVKDLVAALAKQDKTSAGLSDKIHKTNQELGNVKAILKTKKDG